MLVCRGYTFSAICRGYVISSPFITGFWGPILEVYCHFFSNNKQSIDLNSFKSLFRISAFKYRTSASKSFHVLDVAHLQVAVFPKNQGIPTERCHYDESNLLITVFFFFNFKIIQVSIIFLRFFGVISCRCCKTRQGVQGKQLAFLPTGTRLQVSLLKPEKSLKEFSIRKS